MAIAQHESFLKKNATHPKADLAQQGAGLSQYALKQYDKEMPHFAALLAKVTELGAMRHGKPAPRMLGESRNML